MTLRSDNTRIHSCNIVHVGPEAATLWHFSVNHQVRLTGEQTVSASEVFPPRLVRRDWRSLFRNSVNIAWLPAEEVFLRVVQLPTDNPEEVPSMIEFQLEKLSPLPVNQLVWSYELLPYQKEGFWTAIVVMVSRGVVETFIGRLERQGYQPDRLELPVWHQLRAIEIYEDGVWIFPGREGDERHYCLIVWWSEGSLQSLSLVYLGNVSEWAQTLVKKIDQVAWAGEIEGWLSAPPKHHLVADADQEAVWWPAINRLVDSPVEVVRPLATSELAGFNARQFAEGKSRINLLPEDFAARYRQEFVDGLWMRSLGAVIALYVIGVILYFGALEVLRYQRDQAEGRVAAISQSYTNALQLQEQVSILREQRDLRFAALDAWMAAVEALPEGLSFREFRFQEGESLQLRGSAPSNSQVTDYSEALNQATVDGRRLFADVRVDSQLDPPNRVQWTFECQLNLGGER